MSRIVNQVIASVDPGLVAFVIGVFTFIGSSVPGYIVGRARLGGTGLLLSAGAFVAGFVIVVALVVVGAVNSGCPSCVDFLIAAPAAGLMYLIPFLIGYWLGGRTKPRAIVDIDAGREPPPPPPPQGVPRWPLPSAPAGGVPRSRTSRVLLIGCVVIVLAGVALGLVVMSAGLPGSVETLAFGTGGTQCTLDRTARTFAPDDPIRVTAEFTPSLPAGTAVTMHLTRNGAEVDPYPQVRQFNATTSCISGLISPGPLPPGRYHMNIVIVPDAGVPPIAGDFEISSQPTSTTPDSPPATSGGIEFGLGDTGCTLATTATTFSTRDRIRLVGAGLPAGELLTIQLLQIGKLYAAGDRPTDPTSGCVDDDLPSLPVGHYEVRIYEVGGATEAAGPVAPPLALGEFDVTP